MGQLPAVVVRDAPAPLLDVNSAVYRRELEVRRCWLNFVLLTCFLQARIRPDGRAFADDNSDGTPNVGSLGAGGECQRKLIFAKNHPLHQYYSSQDVRGEIMLTGEDVSRLLPEMCLNDDVRSQDASH